ncbi:uncharacterized protein At2g33490-like [Ananas comosus]|uniref:Uncharacterized protein At2g33490-like n=1 Tax=Ananas comosus TaxID=4615 RepID=A0A6P5EY71_ANACO|nr:uncharacterized protein At2g33490-like [Ananas comosus]XP_020088510.1 uncharacterized protein At2g33490-like [Ananas comosus]
MKSSLRKLRGFALHRYDRHKERREPKNPPGHHDELFQAAQDMVDMKNSYDSLLSAAAATANSAYEFSEALREMGTCLLEKIAINDDEESGRVLLMLGKAQFELQKLVDSYRIHVTQTITTPSESLLKELQNVEDMKRQCDDKRDLYKFILAANRDKGRSRHSKGENFTTEQLQQAQEDYQEEATLFAFRLKSLKQGQLRSLLTQAVRHHAAQLSFFRKGVKSLEVVEPHVKAVAEQQHIDYHFSGLEDENSGDDEEGSEDDDNDSHDGSHDGELSFDYGRNDQVPDVGSISRNSMDEHHDKSQADFLSFNRGLMAGSQSAPILTEKKLESSERVKELRPSSTKKFHTYVLPTPGDTHSASLSGPINPDRQSQPTQLWHTSPLHPSMFTKDSRENETPPHTRTPKEQSVLRESNINSWPTRIKPPPLSEGITLPIHKNLQNDPDSTKKMKKEAFSGPLTSQPMSVEHPRTALAPVKPAMLIPPPQPSASPPPISSPRINELHELPRPPVNSFRPYRPSSLIPHSAPLVPMNFSPKPSNNSSVSSQTASPLPTPPGAMARSFSIPSSGQRTPRVSVATLTRVPENRNSSMDVSSSPPLTSSASDFRDTKT